MTPVTNPSLPSFTWYVVLYTVNVTNRCDVAATNVRLEDVVRTSLPATVALVVWPAPVIVEPAGTLAMGGTVVQPDGTQSVAVNGHIPELPAGGVGVFQFWATVLHYEFDGAPQHTQLIDEAEIESDLLEEDLVNNRASVTTNLF